MLGDKLHARCYDNDKPCTHAGMRHSFHPAPGTHPERWHRARTLSTARVSRDVEEWQSRGTTAPSGASSPIAIRKPPRLPWLPHPAPGTGYHNATADKYVSRPEGSSNSRCTWQQWVGLGKYVPIKSTTTGIKNNVIGRWFSRGKDNLSLYYSTGFGVFRAMRLMYLGRLTTRGACWRHFGGAQPVQIKR